MEEQQVAFDKALTLIDGSKAKKYIIAQENIYKKNNVWKIGNISTYFISNPDIRVWPVKSNPPSV